jgi:lipopolysaccharide/colanic/teichoic acid biosynthesis glycosyltransferase
MKREMQPALKRITDVVLGVVGLVICFPVIALAVAAIKLDSEGPVFFRFRIQFDVSYVENYSLRDFSIIARTIPVVFQCNGIYGKDGRVRIPDLG